MLSSVFAAAARFLKQNATDPMRGLFNRLRDIGERARATTNPADADALRQELGTITAELALLGYERPCGYEQFALLQLAFENARDVVEALRSRPRRMEEEGQVTALRSGTA